jgi:hypothetical protein
MSFVVSVAHELSFASNRINISIPVDVSCMVVKYEIPIQKMRQ